MQFVGIKNKDLVFEIEDIDGEYIIGRDEKCDIVMNFKGVSAQHCRLFIHDNQYALIDLGSSNGTAVNGTRIKRKVLHPKDIIQIGAEKFNVILPEIAQQIAVEKQQTLEAQADSAEIQNTESSSKTASIRRQTRMTKRTPKATRPNVKPKTEKFQADKIPTKAGNSMLWVVIFFVGAVLGIALFIVGFIMKSSADTKIQELQNQISEMERNNSASKGNITLVKNKIDDLEENYITMKSKIENVLDETNDSQRDVSSSIEELKNYQSTFNDRISEIQSILDRLQEQIEDVNNK